MTANTVPPLVHVEGLAREFRAAGARTLAVDNVTFDLRPGETLGLVGESGSGKSTIGRLILRLIDPTAGRIWFEGREITHLSQRELRRLRRQMQLIAQDPYSALNPQRPVGWAVSEPLRIHRLGQSRGHADEVTRLLAQVGVSPELAGAFPNELSGGQLQRIGIARALALSPRLLICDEPVSALDVSIQAQVLQLLQLLQRQLGLTYLFISHNLAVVERISDRVIVLYRGQIMETGTVDSLYAQPRHPYTRALLASVPSIDPDQHREPLALVAREQESIPLEHGCPFRVRCSEASEICVHTRPKLHRVGQEHAVACHAVPETM